MDGNGAAIARTQLNVFFDVDHTLICSGLGRTALRPGAHGVMTRIKEAGHRIFVWSASGEEHCRATVEVNGLVHLIDGCFDKDPRVQPAPDFIIDDDWFLVEKYGGHLVSQYRELNEEDRDLWQALDRLAELGHI